MEEYQNKKHPLYFTWKEMRRRCLSKTHKQYKDYGGRGIYIDKSWDDFKIFVKDMGPKPSKDYSVDRIDNSKGYSKENCRWATAKEQSMNRRLRLKCSYGHQWTTESTIWSHNGKNKCRRCKFCIEAKRKSK